MQNLVTLLDKYQSELEDLRKNGGDQKRISWLTKRIEKLHNQWNDEDLRRSK